jgi:hypothetical protein
MVPHMPLLHDMALVNEVWERDFRSHPLCLNHSAEKAVETEGAMGRGQLISGIVRYKGCVKERIAPDFHKPFQRIIPLETKCSVQNNPGKNHRSLPERSLKLDYNSL